MKIRTEEIPETVKSLKILHYSKIKGKSYDIDGFPKSGEELDLTKHQVKNKEKLISFCQQLVKTAIEDGVGIAATQVGANKKLFAIKEDENIWKIYFHPTFKPVGEEKEVGIESCLSVPGVAVNVSRFKTIEAHWYELDENLEIVEKTETIEGFKSRVYQHEHDHILSKSIADFIK